MAEMRSRTTPPGLVLVVLGSLCLLLSLLPPVALQGEDNSTTVTAGSHGNSSETEGSHEEEPGECEEESETEFDSTVRVARFEFHRVQTIFIILVFIIVVVLAKMGK